MSSTDSANHPNAHAMTTSLAPGYISLPPEPLTQSSYAMAAPTPQFQPNPYTNNFHASQQPPMQLSPTNPRKRRLSDASGPSPATIEANPPAMSLNKVHGGQEMLRQFNIESGLPQPQPQDHQQQQQRQPVAAADTVAMPPPAKKSRVNTPWTPAEEQRLKELRDSGQSWSEIAKSFENRTEGSVKKHWYKDMHYAEFAQNESAALLHAIHEYEANKWKVIGQKVNKPAKACEQFARENFSKDQIAGKVKPVILNKESGAGREV